MVYIFMTQNPYTQTKFYCCSPSHNHSEVFNTEQTLTSQHAQDVPKNRFKRNVTLHLCMKDADKPRIRFVIMSRVS